MTATAYTRLEVLRTFRTRRFFIFSLVFPFVLYILLAAPNRGETDFLKSGVSAPLYYMVGLISFGTMVAVIAGVAPSVRPVHNAISPTSRTPSSLM